MVPSEMRFLILQGPRGEAKAVFEYDRHNKIDRRVAGRLLDRNKHGGSINLTEIGFHIAIQDYGGQPDVTLRIGQRSRRQKQFSLDLKL